MISGFPQPGEYAPGFAGYIEKVRAVTDPVTTLQEQLTETMDLLQKWPEAKRLSRYASEKWSVQQLLGHLTDTERIFACRALRIARGDQTPLPGFAENDYVAAAHAEAASWAALLDEFALVRQANVAMLRNFPAEAWTRQATVNGATTSVRALAYIMAGHLAHHLDILRDRYVKVRNS